MRIVWDCIYPNPNCISRDKYYTYEIGSNGRVTVTADGCIWECTKAQLKEFFRPEVGTWDDIFKTEKIEKTNIDK